MALYFFKIYNYARFLNLGRRVIPLHDPLRGMYLDSSLSLSGHQIDISSSTHVLRNVVAHELPDSSPLTHHEG